MAVCKSIPRISNFWTLIGKCYILLAEHTNKYMWNYRYSKDACWTGSGISISKFCNSPQPPSGRKFIRTNGTPKGLGINQLPASLTFDPCGPFNFKATALLGTKAAQHMKYYPDLAHESEYSVQLLK